MSWFDDHAAELAAAGISDAQAREWESRNTGDYDRLIGALRNNTSNRPFDSQTTDPAQQAANAAADQRGTPAPTLAPAVASSAAPLITAAPVSAPVPSNFGAAPAPFGETYTATPRPAWLQGPYTPMQWTGGDFIAPTKPTVLQTPYTLPTQADLEASPGYLAAQTAMQRGIERSAAAKGTVLSGGFVGRALPRALGEYAGTAYGNLVNQTLGARQQNFGEYSTDVNNAFAQYQQKYGQFSDAASRDQAARALNESAYVTDESNNRNQYLSRYNQYLDAAGMKRQADTDLWGRTTDLADLSLRAAALARP